jgi:mono/diheme cytochrome c family protein
MRSFLIACILVLAMLGLGGFLLLRQGLSARPEGSAAEARLAGYARAWSLPADYRNLRNSLDCSAAVVLADARMHWADHCATCHANNGSGDAMLGRGMYPKPPDMRSATTQAQSDGAIYFTIDNGVRFTGMPAFGQPGPHDTDTWKLVCFVRHLPQITLEEERQMMKLNAKTPDEIEEERAEEEFLNGKADIKMNRTKR